ncbi:MAG: PAS domain S-box protein [Verrucomicrobia bacterium]|nr:PAS domain S-box protein [Verrucomicrobiota bacterium]
MLIQHKIQAGFAAALAFLLLTGVSAWWSEQQNVATFDSFDHTHRVNDVLDEILVEVLNIETGNRGFAISGDEAFLPPYQSGITTVPRALQTAKQMMRENPRQLQRLVVLEPLIQDKIHFASKVLQLRRSGDDAGARQFISQGQGRQTMEEIRNVIGELKSEENHLLPGLKARAKKLSSITLAIVAFGGILSLGMIGLASFIVSRDFAKRKQAEVERELFFTVPLDMLCIIRTDGYLRSVNPAFTQILGWSAEELTTRPYLEFLHPDDRAATQAEIERQLAVGEGVLQFENRCLHKNGSSRVFWWKSVPHPDGLIFATGRDVTEQKAADEALRSREEKLSVTLNSIGDAVLATDAERRITHMNPIAEKLTGWKLAEAQGRPVGDVLHLINEKTRQPAPIPVDEVLATDTIHGLSNHTVLISRDGTERPIRESAAPIRDADGRIIGVVLVFMDVTKEHEIERILRSSEALNRSVINSMMANIAVVDRHGTIIDVNDGWERFARENEAEGKISTMGVGCNYLEVCQREAQELGGGAQQILDGLRGVLDHSRSTFKQEYPCHSPTEDRWFTIHVSPLSREEGGAVIAQINTTASKQAEAEVRRLNENLEQLVSNRTRALRESELRYRSLIETSADAFFLVALDGRILTANSAAARMHGYTEAELIGMNMRDLDDPEAAMAAPGRLQRLQQGETLRFELNHQRKDRSIFPLEVIATPIQIEGEWCILANERDITERARAAERDAAYLRKLHRLSELSLQLSGDPGVIFEEVVVMVATLFEIPVVCLSEVVGQELQIKAVWTNGQTQHDPGSAPLSTSPCATVVSTKNLRLYQSVQEHFPQSAFLRDHNGDAYCGVPSLDAHGNVVAVTCLLDSKPHDFNEEDQQLLRIIAQRVAVELERSRNLAERKKLESLALRSQRMEALGTLSGGVAHDLNNALAPILMGVELLKMRCPQESKILDMFETSARRGAEMVRQLLTFAKGAEGERAGLQVERLVHELESLMKSSFPKNIQLVVTCDPKLPTILGDATQLHQILLNLCVNARDAMPTGGTLTLEALPLEVDEAFASSVPDARPGSYVALRVHDTGTGIPKEIIERIFDPFFTTKSPDKGTGLGLSTVMGIVKSHGGFLQVSSQPELGSTFTAFLPTHVVEGGMPLAPAAAASCLGHGETILLVDDEAAVREMAGVVLQRLNFNPVTATDGADGLQLAMRHQAELRVIITDLHMPHMDGLAFVRVLRLVLPDVPVVVASGRMEDPQAAEMKALGVTHRLDK